MASRYFEDLVVGERHVTPSITITDWHVMQFAAVSMDYFELHTSDEYAKQTQFGRRVAHGLLGLAVADGLKNRSTLDVNAVASLHWSWDFVAPIFLGDTVVAELTIAELRESKSKPDKALVTTEFLLKNQDGEVVQKGRNVMMVLRREHG